MVKEETSTMIEKKMQMKEKLRVQVEER